ncbi:MAG: hypothetical protein ABMA02_10330 [Saprospiraceae bacterium]
MKKNSFIRRASLILLLPLYSVVFGNTDLPPCKVVVEQDKMAFDPDLRFNNIWTEHNVHSNGRKGMFIHLDFSIDGMRGRECQAVAYFYHENGYQLHNRGGGYRTVEGHVSTSTNFTPGYNDCHYSDLKMFIPYGEMHLNGTYSLKYSVGIFANRRQIGNGSKWETFTLTWRTDVPESDCPKCGC